MRQAIAILLTLVPLAAAAGSEHPLDAAARLLMTGDAPAAVEEYRRAVAEEPTLEGYNNLGVALEQAGRYAEAAEAYHRAAGVDGTAKEIRANLLRGRLRAALQRGRVPASALALGILSLYCLIWLARGWKRARRALRVARHLRGIRALSLGHCAEAGQGQQPDGFVYPDTTRLRVQACLALPPGDLAGPLPVAVEIYRPDGSHWRTLHARVPIPPTRLVNLRFPVEELAEVFASPGPWAVRLLLGRGKRVLEGTSFQVVSRADLIADIEATEARVLAVRNGEIAARDVILTDVEELVPTVLLRPATYHPSKYTDMSVRLDLVSRDRLAGVESQEFPLQLDGGSMEFCHASRPVAGEKMAHQPGLWEFRISVGDRPLAHMPFALVSRAQAAEGLKLERFELLGLPEQGPPIPIGGRVVADVRSLRPVVGVTGLSSPVEGFDCMVGACVEGEPVAGVEGKLHLIDGRAEVLPGDFEVPPIPPGREGIRISFIFVVEGRPLGACRILLQRRRQRCADVQGRLTQPPLGVDFDSEAAAILGGAQMR